MYTLARKDEALLLGMLDFLLLLMQSTTSEDKSAASASLYATKEMLLAAMWHYAESVAAIQQGVLDTNFLRENVLYGSKASREGSTAAQTGKRVIYSSSRKCRIIPILRTSTPCSSGTYENNDDELSQLVLPFQARPSAATPLQITNEGTSIALLEGPICGTEASNKISSGITTADQQTDGTSREVWKIARGAAQIKRAEALARAVESEGKQRQNVSPHRTNLKAVLSAEEASRIRGLLLTVDGFDWRALVIRCVACLYRLEGVLGGGSGDSYSSHSNVQRSPAVIRAAREGLHVFATLAQQLGLHSLKNQIEDRAFRILYQRQYRAVSKLYHTKEDPDRGIGPTNGPQSGKVAEASTATVPMEAVSAFLESHITTTLVSDDVLMEQLDDLQVTSRVKEKFSLWRKLVKKSRQIDVTTSSARTGEAKSAVEIDAVVDAVKQHDNMDSPVESKSSFTLSSLASLKAPISSDGLFSRYVPDAIALRVILRARKWFDDEPEEIIRERERLLCYYIQQKLITQWPATDPGRIKDYIRFPKPNGKHNF